MCPHFHLRKKMSEGKEGWKSKHWLHPVTPTATKAKALSRHLRLGTSSPLWCVCKSQKDFLAATRTWLSNGEWWSSLVSLLLLCQSCCVRSGQDYFDLFHTDLWAFMLQLQLPATVSLGWISDHNLGVKKHTFHQAFQISQSWVHWEKILDQASVKGITLKKE